MLTYKKTEKGYQITQNIMGFTSTDTIIVFYTPDLKLKRVNNEPWRECSAADTAWFKKCYADKF